MKISRQQKLKLKYLIGGRCVNCGKKKYLLSKCSCEDCLDKDRDRMRIKTKVKKYLGRKWVIARKQTIKKESQMLELFTNQKENAVEEGKQMHVTMNRGYFYPNVDCREYLKKKHVNFYFDKKTKTKCKL